MKKINSIIACSASLLLTATCTGCGDTGMESYAPVSPQPQTEASTKAPVPATTAKPVPTATIAETTAAPTEPEITDIYADVVSDYCNECAGMSYPYSYAMADLDLDGYPELMVKTGTCEAEYMYVVWTKGANGTAIKAGECSGFHTSLYYNCQNGLLYTNSCQMDGERLEEYSLSNQQIQVTNSYSWNLRDSAYYQEHGYYDPTLMENVYALSERDITDYVFAVSDMIDGTPGETMTIEEYIQKTSENQQTEAAATVSEDTLRSNILAQCSGNQLDWFYDDFDGDGTYEAFAIDGNSSDFGNEIQGIYYADASGNVTLIGTTFWGGFGSGRVVDYSSSKKFFVLNTHNGGSGSTDYLYSVKEGNYYESNLSGSLYGFQVDENGAYTFEPGSDAHERPQIRLYYDESTEDFYQ